jgi:hypothetical protein
MRVAFGLVLSGAIGLAVAAAPTHVGAAGACKTDATDGCEREGLACTPPKGGKCVTVKTPVPLSAPVLSCKCLVPPPPASSSRALNLEPPDPCNSASGREQLLRTGGARGLAARCGHTTTHSSAPPAGHN